MTTASPTPVQARICQFMRDFLAKEDRMPSSYEIAHHFGCCQTNALVHLRRMAAKGILEFRKADGKYGWWRFPRKEGQ